MLELMTNPAQANSVKSRSSTLAFHRTYLRSLQIFGVSVVIDTFLTLFPASFEPPFALYMGVLIAGLLIALADWLVSGVRINAKFVQVRDSLIAKKRVIPLEPITKLYWKTVYSGGLPSTQLSYGTLVISLGDGTEIFATGIPSRNKNSLIEAISSQKPA
jgi:hypothetical protein